MREGELYSKHGLFVKPYMIAANCFVDVIYNGKVISLTKHEFSCLTSVISKLKIHYDFLNLVKIVDSDEVDIPFPSHLYVDNVLELSSDCFMYTAQHNNDILIFLKKNLDVCILPESIFHIEFDMIQNMQHTLAINYSKNWCFYCDQHKSIKNCVVCAND